MPMITETELARLNELAKICERWGKEKIWIVIYSHRHGLDAWPILQNADEDPPTAESIAASIEDWEGEERDEFIEILGPWNRTDG